MTTRRSGKLLHRRHSEVTRVSGKHRSGADRLLRRYGLTGGFFCLCEQYERIDEAIAREKAMKAWQRQWKTRLIEEANPSWDDLWEHING